MPSHATPGAPAAADSAPPAPSPALRWHRLLTALLLLTGSAISLWAWHSGADHLAREADAEFDRYSDLSFSNISQRVEHQLDLLASFQALFRAGNEVSRADFHRTFTDLRVRTRFPGVQAIQYARWVSEDQRPAFEAAVQQDRSLQPEGYPGFAVRPPGPRDHYMAVLFNEPMQGNESALGYDTAAEASRREVLERSRDSGQAQASAPLKLLQQRPGVVVRLPVYRSGLPLDTVAQRRTAMTGQITGVLLVEDLLRDTLPTQRLAPYQVTVSDHGLIDPPATGVLPTTTLVARSRHATLADLDAGPPRSEDRREHTLAMAGRTWTVEVARPHVNQALAPFALLLLAGGLAITGLLALLIGRLSQLQQRAHRLALALSAQARAHADRLHTVFDSTADGIITTDRHGTLLSVNRAAQRIFGHSAEAFQGRSLTLLMPLAGAAQPAHWLTPDSRNDNRTGSSSTGSPAGSPPDRSRSLLARHANGSLFPIELSISEMLVDGQRQFVGLLRDMTAAQAAQARIDETAQALRAANELREAVFDHAAFALIVTDAAGLIQAMNPAAERLLACRAEAEVGRHTLASFVDDPDQPTLGQMQAQHLAHARQAQAGGMPLVEPQRGIERSLHSLRRDGSRVAVSLTLSALHDAEGQVSGYLSISYDITERQRLADQLSQLAYHDGLTGLPNRLQLEDRLQQSIAQASRSHGGLALLFIDLDHFKPINDRFGHAVGDQVLREVARRLQGQLRAADLVARLGGDEFVVLLSTLTQTEDCLLVADKLLLTLAEPMLIGNQRLQVGASVGLARYPESGSDAASLLRSADAAMYAAKVAGRSSMPMAGQGRRAEQP